MRQYPKAAASSDAQVLFQQLLQDGAHLVEPEAAHSVGEQDVSFEMSLSGVIPGMDGWSLAEIVTKGTPAFPPIEGLPEEVWKDQSCSNCHSWTAENLCVQGQTYLTETGKAALGKVHPLDGFKQVVRNWAATGCP